MKRIYCIYGGIIGWDAVFTSVPLQVLAERLKSYGLVNHYFQQRTGKLVDDICNQLIGNDKAIIVTYSGGGPMGTVACQTLARRSVEVALLVNLDGSPAANMQVVGRNVKLVLDICNPKPQPFLFWNLGCGITPIADEERTFHEVYRVAVNHFAYPSNVEVMKLVEDAVRSL